VPDEQIQALSAATRTSIGALLAAKLLPAPSVHVLVNTREIKEHGDRESVVRMRLVISEDAYEVVIRADGEGYTLTPE
jgi:hypothetical protein